MASHIFLGKIILNIILLIFLLFPGVFAKKYTFIEKNGVVSIEAEHYTNNVGPWEEVEGRNAVNIEYQGMGMIQDSIIIIQTPNHPAVEGFIGNVKVTSKSGALNWGFPNQFAQILASVRSAPDKAAIFTYDQYDSMPGLIAPSRRAGFFLRTSEVTPAGWALFEHLVEWMISGAPEQKKAILLANSTRPGKMDQQIIHHLRNLGMIVNIIDDDKARALDAQGYDLIVISESVSSGVVGNKFREVQIPVLVCEPYLYDDMGMIVSRPPWKESEGQYGNAMLIRYGEWSDHLHYAIYFYHTGTYQLWFLGKNAGDSGADEVKVFFDAKEIKRDEKFFTVQFPDNLAWTNQISYRTPNNIKMTGRATITVGQPGWHHLFLVKGAEPEHADNPPPKRKYPNWRVDKILFLKEKPKPQGDGPPETLNDGTVDVPEDFLKDTEFYPEQIWVEKDGFVVVEAEEIDHHEYWQFRTEPKGFTGKGYLVWQGPNRSRSIEGLGGNHDELFVMQGPQEEWLIIRVAILHPGFYQVNARNFHKKVDGDNDAWISLVGFRPDPKKGTRISRMGDSHRDGTGFTWLDWGIRRFYLHKGINDIYISGRSVGFGIDRIAIYRDKDEMAKAKALNLNTVPSSLYNQN